MRHARKLARHRKARRKLIKAGITAGVFVLLVIVYLLARAPEQNTTVMPSICYVRQDLAILFPLLDPSSVSSTVVTPVDGIIQDVQVSEGAYVHKG